MSPELGIEIRDKIISTFSEIEDESVYGQVLSIILTFFESRHGVFGYIDDNGDLIAPSLTRDVWDKCEVRDKSICFKREDWGKSNAIWARAMITGETLLSNKPYKVPKGHIPINRSLAVPIKHHDTVIGLIHVGNKEVNYTNKDIKAMETVASYISPILHIRLERERSERELLEVEKRLKKTENEKLNSKRNMLSQLDNIDKQILYQLYIDGKQSPYQLQKTVKMSHTGIQNRIKKLTKSGILKIQGNLSPRDLECRVAYINIQFINFDIVDKYIEQYQNCPRIFLLSKTTGQYHIMLGIVGRTIDDLNVFINHCLLAERHLISNSDIIFASELSKPDFLPLNIYVKDIERTDCGRNCLSCEQYQKNKCFGCDFL